MIYCQKCGAGWGLESINIKGNKGAYHRDSKQMGTRGTTYFLEGRGCPKCDWGNAYSGRERTVKAEMTQVLMERHRDNLEFIASELEDMERMGLLGEHAL